MTTRGRPGAEPATVPGRRPSATSGAGRPGGRRQAKAPRSRPGQPPIPWIADACQVMAALGLFAVIADVLIRESRGALAAPGGVLIFGARLAGFTAAYLMLVMVWLIARLPWLERAVGQDQLLRWHRKVGPWPLWLISGHVVLVTLGYAAQARTGWARQLWVLLTTYPDVLAAAAAFGLLLTAGLTSIRIARRRLAYETWWAVHLYIYLAIGLSLAHQVATGASFVGHPLTRTIWLTAWFVTAGMVLAFRVGLPIARSLRHQLRVEQVRAEAPGTFSVICRGRKLDRLAVSGGQFFQWRFLTRGLWWHAHPYSLSALPRPPYIRVTVRGLGDHSHAIARLRPGTRVAIEGPYGAFTRHARAGDQLALIGAGVGMTPLLALLEDLPPSADVVVIARASSPEHLVHRDEVAALVRRRGGRYHEVTGPRERVPLDERALRRLIPDLAHRDIYVCGPDGFSAGVMAAAQRLGAPADRIHCEAFAF